MKVKTSLNDIDWILLGLVLAISALGLLQIASATRGSALAGLQWKQMGWIALGLAAMLVISRVDYHALLEQAPVLYLLAVASLLAVLVLGQSKFGARRWLPIGGSSFQVSEAVKLVIIIVLARYLSELRTERPTL